MLAWVLVLALSASVDQDPSFVEGLKLYDALEYEQAAFRFQEVALRTPSPGPDRARVFAYLGLSFAGAGDLEAAKRAFVDAVRADRAVVLPVEVSPSLAQLFEDAKASVPADEPAPLTPAEPTQATESGGGVPLLAIVGVASGAALVLGGVGLGVLCVVAYNEATTARERDATQLEAQAALDRANLSLIGATALVPIGAAIAGVSVFFLAQGGE